MTQEARSNFIEANKLLRKGDYSGAMDKLTAVLIQNPGNGVAREQIYQISRLMATSAIAFDKVLPGRMTEIQRTDMVEIAYQSLRKTSPRKIERRLQEAQLNISRRYYLLACHNYLSLLTLPGLELEEKYQIEKRLRSTIQKADIKIESLPEDTRGIYREAFTLMSLGDWESSVEDWQKYLKQNPKDLEVKKLLSTPEAVTILKERKKLQDAYTALSVNESKKAITLFKEVLKLNPSNGEAERGMKLADKRLEDRKKLKRVNRLLSQAEKFMKSGKKEKAVKALSKALRESPSDERILAMIQTVIQNSNAQKKTFANATVKKRPRMARADEEVNRALAERDIAKAETHYHKGLVYYSLRNYRDAYSEFKVAFKYDPKSRKINQAMQRVKSDLQFEKQK